MSLRKAGHRIRIGVALVAATQFAGCQRDQKVPENPPTPVKIAVVEQYSGNQGAIYSASIVPIAQMPLLFKSGGFVTNILQRKGADGRMRDVQLGDIVAKGTVLATVRQQDYRDVVAQAQGQLGQAQAAQVKATEDMKRATALLAANAMTQANFDAATQQLATANGSVVSAQGALSQAQQSLSDCELRVPIDSVILSRNIELGALVTTGTQGFSIADIHLVKAVFGVPDTLLGTIHLGASQVVTTETIPEQFVGKITAIAPQADQKSRTFQVEVTIPNPKGRLVSGMVATLNLGQVRQILPVLVVPLSAIVASGEHAQSFSVFLVTRDGDREVAKQRPVKPGSAYGDQVEIVNGVSAGDRVITSGATLVKDGQVVRVIS